VLRPATAHRADLVHGEVLVAADVELDERGPSVLRDLAFVAGGERRANVLDDLEARDGLDDVRDRRLEGGIARPERRALDQDGLVGRLLETGLEDLVHAARLARARRVGVEGLRADRAADSEGDEDEGEPAERGGLPVSRTPAAHAGREILRLRAVRGAEHR
jgi:hypothetical protein